MQEQKGRLDRVGVGPEKNRGAADVFGKKQFPVSPYMGIFHWSKGNGSVIILTTAHHDCVQASFEACHGAVVYME